MSDDIFTFDKSHCPRYRDGQQCDMLIDRQFCKLPNMFRCIEYVKTHEPRLSYSSIQSYTHCHRKFWYSWICGLEPRIKSLPLTMGSICSKVMAHIHSLPSTLDFIRIIRTEAKDYIVGDENDKRVAWPYAMIGFFQGYTALGYHTTRCESEVFFSWKEPEMPEVIGYIDRKPYPGHEGDGKPPQTIAYEDKYSSSPDWYDFFTMRDQVMTYFLGDPKLQRITARIMVHPQTKLASNESISDFIDRVARDVQSRPKHYIRDMNFYRTEYDFKQYKWKIKRISEEIINNMQYGIQAFYQDDQACFNPPCDYKPICTSNDVISETLYVKKDDNRRSGGVKKEEKKMEKKAKVEVDDDLFSF